MESYWNEKGQQKIKHIAALYEINFNRICHKAHDNNKLINSTDLCNNIEHSLTLPVNTQVNVLLEFNKYCGK